MNKLFMRTIIFLVIFSLFSSVAFCKSNEAQIEKARIACQNAGEFIKKNDWKNALSEAKKAVEAAPDYAGGHLLCGIINVKTGELETAEKELKKTIELDPEIPESYTYMGKIYYYRDKLDKALEYYKKAVSKGTQEVLAYQDMGNIYYQKSRDIINSGGKKGEGEEKMSLAIENYKKAIKIDQKNSELHNLLGAAYYFIGQTGNALGEYEKAIELDKKNAAAYSNLGEYYLYQKKDFAKSTECYQTAIKLYGNEISSSNFSGKELKAKKLELALCHFGLGSIYNFQNKAEESIKEFNEVLKTDKDNAQAYVGLASSYELKGDKNKAVEYFKKALKLATDQKNEKLKKALEDKLKRMGQ